MGGVHSHEIQVTKKTKKPEAQNTHLVLGGISDQSLLVVESDIRGSSSVTLVIGNDLNSGRLTRCKVTRLRGTMERRKGKGGRRRISKQ